MDYGRISTTELNRRFAEIDNDPNHMKYWSRKHKMWALIEAQKQAELATLASDYQKRMVQEEEEALLAGLNG